MKERAIIINTPIEGNITDIRPEIELPSEVAVGPPYTLPPYVEITTDEGLVVQAHPSRVIIVI